MYDKRRTQIIKIKIQKIKNIQSSLNFYFLKKIFFIKILKINFLNEPALNKKVAERIDATLRISHLVKFLDLSERCIFIRVKKRTTKTHF